MNLQPTLADRLIILRPLKESDFDALYEVAKDPLIWEQHPCYNRYEKRAYTAFFDGSLASRGALVILDRSTGEIIGSTRFKPVKGTENAIEIGWSFLSRDYWGGEYNRSMKTLMIDYAFESVENVVFYIGKDNIRSQKAVEKIGGSRIFEPHLSHLMKRSKIDWTYRVNRMNWNH